MKKQMEIVAYKKFQTNSFQASLFNFLLPLFVQKGLPGPIGPMGPAGPTGEKVNRFLCCSLLKFLNIAILYWHFCYLSLISYLGNNL